MTLQQLQYFLAAFRHGSFSAAAEELHLAQPSLSEQVRRLEAELGVRLFQRVGRGLKPTEAGNTAPARRADAGRGRAARGSVVAVRELRGGTATFGTWGTARYYPGWTSSPIPSPPSERARARRRPELVGGRRGRARRHWRRDGLAADRRPRPRRPADHAREILYASTDPAREHAATIEALAAGVADPRRRQLQRGGPHARWLAGLAQRVGVSIQPQIDVEDIEAALELAARGLGDTIVSRGILLAMGRRVSKRLGWVPFAEPFYTTFAFVSRANAPL